MSGDVGVGVRVDQLEQLLYLDQTIFQVGAGGEHRLIVRQPGGTSLDGVLGGLRNFTTRATRSCTLARLMLLGNARCGIGFHSVGVRSPTVRFDQNPNVIAATTSACVGAELRPRLASAIRAWLA